MISTLCDHGAALKANSPTISFTRAIRSRHVGRQAALLGGIPGADGCIGYLVISTLHRKPPYDIGIKLRHDFGVPPVGSGPGTCR